MSGSPSHHNLFLYDDDGALFDQVVPFLTQGIAEREAVVIVLDPRKTALVREALGPIAARVAFVDRDTYAKGAADKARVEAEAAAAEAA